MLTANSANKHSCNFTFIILISLFVLSLSLFQYHNIYSQILNTKPLDSLEYQAGNMVNVINDIDMKKFSYFITINHPHLDTLDIANSYPFNSSTKSGIFGDNYESKDTNKIFLPLPTACVFYDGESPHENPDDCFPIRNNEDTGGIDNIFFSLTFNENIDSFSCALRNRDGGLLISIPEISNPSECKIDNNNAQQSYTDLPEGAYTFQVIATKSENITGNNINTETRIETVPFNFHVRMGEGAGAGVGILEIVDSADV